MSAAPTDPEQLRARREAAAWLVKHDRGLQPAEQDEFFQWLAADPLHREWYTRHRESWQRLEGIVAWTPADHGLPNPDVLARPVARRWTFAPRWLAAAAALAIVGGAWWVATVRDKPAVVAAAAEPVRYERRVLEDGTIAELNGGAELTVRFTPHERLVELRGGEATFTVSPNPARPFTVNAAGVQVRAVGTAFNVRYAAGAVEVLVTEGKVQVKPPVGPELARAPGPLIIEGERAIVPLARDAEPQVARATEEDFARLRSWQPQLLDFSSTPLASVIAELNRRNRVQIVLADPASAGVPIVASIRSDNLDGFVTLVASATGLHAERTHPYEIVLRAAR